MHYDRFRCPSGGWLEGLRQSNFRVARDPGAIRTGTSTTWRLYVNMDCPLAERLHEESQYGSWHSGAVTFAVQHAQVGAPRTHGRPILVRHDSGDLVKVREVVSCPCREQL